MCCLHCVVGCVVFVVWCMMLLVAVSGLLRVCMLLTAARLELVVGCCVGVCCVLLVGTGLLCVMGCLLFIVCCLVCVVCWLLCVV